MGVCIGDRGKTASVMSPGGKVIIDGTPYDARAEAGWMPSGCECIVVAQDLGGLVVRVFHPTQSELPDQGRMLQKSESQLSLAEVAVLQAARIESIWILHVRRVRRGFVLSTILGGIVGLITFLVGLYLQIFSQLPIVQLLLLAVGVIAVGCLACPALFAMSGLVNAIHGSVEFESWFQPKVSFCDDRLDGHRGRIALWVYNR